MARLRRQWGVQARYFSERDLGLPWRPPAWADSHAEALEMLDQPHHAHVTETRLVTRVVSDTEVVDDGQASA